MTMTRASASGWPSSSRGDASGDGAPARPSAAARETSASAAPATAISSVPKSLSLLSRRSGGERPRYVIGQRTGPGFGGGAGGRAVNCGSTAAGLRGLRVDCHGADRSEPRISRGSGGGDATGSANQRQEPRATTDRSHNRCKRAAVFGSPFAACQRWCDAAAHRIFASSHIEITRGDHLVPDHASHPNAVPAHRCWPPLPRPPHSDRRAPQQGRRSRRRSRCSAFPSARTSKLFDYDQSIDYFTKLAAASNRIHLINVGKTSFGKPWTAAIISSPANLARLDHDPRDQHAPRAPGGTDRRRRRATRARGKRHRRHQRRPARVGDRRFAAHAAARVRAAVARERAAR